MLFGVSVLKGVSLPATSPSKNHLKIFNFWVEDFLSRGFLVFQGTKRRKSFVDFRVF